MQSRRQLVGSKVVLTGPLCHMGMSPLVLTGLLRNWMAEKFANPANIESPDLKDGDHPAIWRPDASTGIMIESVWRWRGDIADKRPAVLLNRNSYRNLRVLIGDRVGINGRGFPNFATLWVGSHTVFCIHGTGASCEILATEVQREITQFAWHVAEMAGLLRLQVTEVGAISTVEEATQNFVCPITVGWAYQETWQIDSETLPFKGPNLEISLENCGVIRAVDFQ